MYYPCMVIILFNPIQMGLFGAAHGWVGGGGGAKRTSPTLKSVTYDETWHSYTLPKEDAKNI